MKKGLVIITIIAAFLFSMGLIAWVYAAAAVKAPETIKIDNDKAFFKDGKRTKPAVEFSHLKHQKTYKIDCTECHHLYKDGKNTWKQGTSKVQKCTECHKATEQGKILTLQNGYHKNCKDCHAKMKNEGKKTGPVICAQCHVEGKK